MPLRYFQPAQSQVLPEYQPLPLDALQYGVEKADQVIQRNREQLSHVDERIQTNLAGLTEGNRNTVQPLIQDDLDFIERAASGEADVPFQDMYQAINRRARNTGQQLQPFLQDSAAVQAYVADAKKQWEKGTISQERYEYMRRAANRHQGLQFDEDGELTGNFAGPDVVRQVDVNKRMQDFLGKYQAGDVQGLIDEYGQDERFVRQIFRKGFTPETQAQIAQAAMDYFNTDRDTVNFMHGELEAINDREAAAGVPPAERTTMQDLYSGVIQPHLQQLFTPQDRMSFSRNPGFEAGGLAQFGQPLAGEMVIGTGSAPFNSVRQFRQQAQEATKAIDAHRNILNNTIESYGYSPNDVSLGEDGNLVINNPVGADGRDHTAELQILAHRYRMAQDNANRMQSTLSSLYERAGLEARDIDEIERLEESFIRQHISAAVGNQRTARGHGAFVTANTDEITQRLESLTDEERSEILSSPAFDNYLGQRAGPIKERLDKFKEDIKDASRTITPISLGTGPDRQYQNYLMRTPQAVRYAKDNQLVDDVRGSNPDYHKSEFVGVAHVPGEGIRAFFQVPFLDSSGNIEGWHAVHAPPMHGTEELFFKANRMDDWDQMHYSQLSQLSDLPGGIDQVDLQVTANEGAVTQPVPVRIISRAEAQRRPTASGRIAQFEVTVPNASGGDIVHVVSDATEVLNIVGNYHRLFIEANK